MLTQCNRFQDSFFVDLHRNSLDILFFFGSVNIVLSSRIAESCKRRNAFPNQRVASTLPVKDFDLVPSPSQHVVSELLVKDFVFAFSGPTP